MPAIFNPTLSYQRYCWVQHFLEQRPDVTTVTDVGCGNGRMVLWIKAVLHIEEINCIDADAILLECQMDNYLRPNLFEVLFGRRHAKVPVDIRVFQGDIAVPDERLQADCFTLIEVIEHLTFEHLEKVSRTVFGYYKPKYVVVSTPNSEFNHILRQLGDNDRNAPKDPNSTFRHHDHKFEWNRNEFNQWAQSISQQFGYEFQIDGVGQLPNYSESFGPCTQIAIFRLRSTEQSGVNIDGDLTCFDLLLNKLSVKPSCQETLNEVAKRKICLMGSFTVPADKGLQDYPRAEEVDWTNI